MIAEHTQTATEAPIVLQCVDLCKCYNGVVQASDHINFTLRRGEVHAFLGENGAGKSTLMKMLYGIEQPDEGQLFLSGEPVALKSPADAIAHGIGMVHQELMLIPHLTVAENITLGQEVRTRCGRLKKQEASRSIRELAASYGLDIDPDALVDKLTIGQRQRVEIVKLLYRKADILIFDEPTALLTPQESDALFDVLRRLRELGKSTIFITHKLREVYQIADRMTVIRQGRIIGTTTPQETGMEKLTQMMVGKTVPTGRRRPHPIGAEEVLQVKDLSVQSRGGAAVQNVTFSIRSGEVLGVAGIEGNGQTPLAQALLGLCRPSSGSILLDGREITGRTTKQIRDAGVGSIPDDRQGMGLVLQYSIQDNFMLNRFAEKPFAKSPFWLDQKAASRCAEELLESFDVRAAGINVPVGTLSGGNQQKVVVGRELSIPLKLLIAAQPTRGVDIASAASIQNKIMDAAEHGTGVLLISSDLDELIHTSDRIMVMSRGKIVDILEAKNATKERLGQLMLGVSQET